MATTSHRRYFAHLQARVEWVSWKRDQQNQRQPPSAGKLSGLLIQSDRTGRSTKQRARCLACAMNDPLQSSKTHKTCEQPERVIRVLPVQVRAHRPYDAT